MQQTLTPHVYWAQRHEDIYLRVELIDAQVSGERGPVNPPFEAINKPLTNILGFYLARYIHHHVLQCYSEVHIGSTFNMRT